MKLSDYLEAQKESVTAFAKRAGLEVPTVHRVAHGKVSVPSPGTLKAIAKATGGAVMPNDFYDIPAV